MEIQYVKPGAYPQNEGAITKSDARVKKADGDRGVVATSGLKSGGWQEETQRRLWAGAESHRRNRRGKG